MSVRQVEFTDAEFILLADNIEKIHNRNQNRPDEFTLNFGKSLETLNTKLVVNKENPVGLTRHERRSLAIFLDTVIQMLSNKVIAGYKKRMITPASTEKYKPYWETAKAKKLLLDGLVEKLK